MSVVVPAALELRVRRLDALHDAERVFVGLFGDDDAAFWLDGSSSGERARFSFLGAAGGPLSAFVTSSGSTAGGFESTSTCRLIGSLVFPARSRRYTHTTFGPSPSVRPTVDSARMSPPGASTDVNERSSGRPGEPSASWYVAMPATALSPSLPSMSSVIGCDASCT